MDISRPPGSSPVRPIQPSARTPAHAAWVAVVFAVLTIALGIPVGILVAQLDSPMMLVAAVTALVSAVFLFMRPELGLFLLLFISNTRFSDVLINQFGLPSIAKLLVALLAGILLVRWAVLGESPRGWVKPLLLLTAYGIVIFFSLFHAADYDNAFDRLANYVDDAVICLLVVILLQRGRFIRLSIWALLASGLFMASIGAYQYLTGSFSQNFWGFGNAPLMNIAGESSNYRIAGPFGSPNAYAQVLVVLVPLAFDRLMHERKMTLRGLAGLILVLCTLNIIFTFSRGGFLALAVTMLAVTIQYKTSLARYLVIGVLVLILIPFLPGQYRDRLATLVDLSSGSAQTGDASFRGRSSEYLVGVMMFSDNPLLGVGADNYPTRYLEYSRQLGIDPRNQQRAPHSLYIQIAAEQGLIGMFVFGLLMWNVFHGMHKSSEILNQLKQHRTARMVTALSIGFLGYMTSALFIHGSYPRHFWLLVGIALAAYEIARNEVKKGDGYRL